MNREESGTFDANVKKLLAFDIEIATELPEGDTDWHKHGPLGISCAGLQYGDEGIVTYHHPDRLSRAACRRLVLELKSAAYDGWQIVTWNGAGFDFRVLAEESGEYDLCYALALRHVDMMFHFFCSNGYALGLDKAAKGLGLPGKTEGMDGSLAPEMWAEGRYSEVLSYLLQDIKTTLDVARSSVMVHESGKRGIELRWMSRSGRPMSWSGGDRWLSVQEALNLPEPDTGWMTDPWPRAKFTGWMSTPEEGDDGT